MFIFEHWKGNQLDAKVMARAPISWLDKCRKYNHLIGYISNSIFKKISIFLQRGSQSSYIVNSLPKRNNFTKWKPLSSQSDSYSLLGPSSKLALRPPMRPCDQADGRHTKTTLWIVRWILHGLVAMDTEWSPIWINWPFYRCTLWTVSWILHSLVAMDTECEWSPVWINWPFYRCTPWTVSWILHSSVAMDTECEWSPIWINWPFYRCTLWTVTIHIQLDPT